MPHAQTNLRTPAPSTCIMQQLPKPLDNIYQCFISFFLHILDFWCVFLAFYLADKINCLLVGCLWCPLTLDALCTCLFCLRVNTALCSDLHNTEHKQKINVRKYRRGNQKWTIQRNWQQSAHKTKKNKIKTQRNICWTRLYTQTNTNDVNMT